MTHREQTDAKIAAIKAEGGRDVTFVACASMHLARELADRLDAVLVFVANEPVPANNPECRAWVTEALGQIRYIAAATV